MTYHSWHFGWSWQGQRRAFRITPWDEAIPKEAAFRSRDFQFLCLALPILLFRKIFPGTLWISSRMLVFSRTYIFVRRRVLVDLFAGILQRPQKSLFQMDLCLLVFSTFAVGSCSQIHERQETYPQRRGDFCSM